MSTRTTLHRLALASAVAAMLASAAPNAFAQAADTPPAAPPMASPAPMPPDSTASAPMASMPMSGTTAVPTPPMNLPTDYSILNNRVFDGVDLQQARARGLSDSQIATIIKISKETGYSFRSVSAQVEQGQTFASIATMYGVKLADVYSNDKEKQEVSDYDALSMYAASLSKNSGMTPSTMPATMPMTPTDTTAPKAELDIVDTAMAAKNLTTLVTALKAAGLVETLKGAGPFTVFAPDDKAFSKLPAGALDALLADPVKLKQVLTYHVIPGNIMAADAMNMSSPTSPPTVNGATLEVTKRKGKLKINDATVTKADIKASNGTIHIIDGVLMPPATDTATPPAAPDAATPPAAPAAPAPMDATPPVAPATPDATPPAAPAMPAPPAQ